MSSQSQGRSVPRKLTTNLCPASPLNISNLAHPSDPISTQSKTHHQSTPSSYLQPPRLAPMTENSTVARPLEDPGGHCGYLGFTSCSQASRQEEALWGMLNLTNSMRQAVHRAGTASQWKSQREQRGQAGVATEDPAAAKACVPSPPTASSFPLSLAERAVMSDTTVLISQLFRHHLGAVGHSLNLLFFTHTHTQCDSHGTKNNK